MGNQLTGVAPSQILPVEQYLSDVPHFHFIEKYDVFNFLHYTCQSNLLHSVI